MDAQAVKIVEILNVVNMARREVYVVEANFGFTKCSECGANVENHYDKCPKCNIEFNEKTYYGVI